MKILTIGDTNHLRECSAKFHAHDITHAASHQEATNVLRQHDLVFDFLISKLPDGIDIYAGTDITVFLNTCTKTLAELTRNGHAPRSRTIFGFDGFPTLLNRELLEVSLLNTADTALLEQRCQQLNTAYAIVDDRVGLVTPRVICMIINEAYYTLQEGTASRDDIDLAMKLGTNYPYGPFEWCERIGLSNVYDLLAAVYADTRDERYKISALMKKEYLRLGKENL